MERKGSRERPVPKGPRHGPGVKGNMNWKKRSFGKKTRGEKSIEITTVDRLERCRQAKSSTKGRLLRW